MPVADPDQSLFSLALADGRPLLTLATLGLAFAGCFAIFLGLAGQFLPHDIQYLGMTAQELCHKNACSIVHFMIHDRVAFGGILVSLSLLYLWLIHFPIHARQPWAFYTLLTSVSAGFASFLSYLAFGYIDTWHAAATLILLPLFATGLTLAYRTLPPHHLNTAPVLHHAIHSLRLTFSSRRAFGRTLLLSTSAALFVAGLTITIVGLTIVFVPEDLAYMETTVEELNTLSPRLIPLIAHDRAGFGTGVLNVGFLLFACVFFSPSPPRHLRQTLLCTGLVGFTSAIGIHPLVGYNNPVHLAPAILAAAAFFLSLLLIPPPKTPPT